MGNEEILKRITQNNARGEELVKFIEDQIPFLRSALAKKQQQKLSAQIQEKNAELKSQLEYWKKRVFELEVMNGIKQYPLPEKESNLNSDAGDSLPTKSAPSEKVESTDVSQKPLVDASVEDTKQTTKQLKKDSTKAEKKGKSGKPEKQPSAEENKEINVSRLDLRIGRILSAKKHPDAETLYVEEIDVGEEKPRTVVSGLVKYVPLEEMQNRLVIVLCNLKPAKMRGVTSEAMVMCASSPEKVEILCPPPDSVPGDRVVCDEYPGEPDTLLPPKKKIFEQVAPDLKTNGECLAAYKSALLKVAGKGVIKSATLSNVQVK